jgi:solute:Na+ symporter, SSS family
VLLTFVIAYLAVTIGIGLLAARRVHGAKDYLVAGPQFALVHERGHVFATWFGAETVLSVSATFAKDGLNGIPGDPLVPPSAWCWQLCCLPSFLPSEPADHR